MEDITKALLTQWLQVWLVVSAHIRDNSRQPIHRPHHQWWPATGEAKQQAPIIPVHQKERGQSEGMKNRRSCLALGASLVTEVHSVQCTSDHHHKEHDHHPGKKQQSAKTILAQCFALWTVRKCLRRKSGRGNESKSDQCQSGQVHKEKVKWKVEVKGKVVESNFCLTLL